MSLTNFSKLMRAKRDPRYLLTRPKATSNVEEPYVPSKFSVLEEEAPEEGVPQEAMPGVGGQGGQGQVPSAGAFEALGESLPPEDPTQAPLPSLGDYRKKMQDKQKKQLNRGV